MSGSSKVIDLDVNRKRICDLLLIINTLDVSPTVFEILTFTVIKWHVLPTLPCLMPPLGEPLRNFG